MSETFVPTYRSSKLAVSVPFTDVIGVIDIFLPNTEAYLRECDLRFKTSNEWLPVDVFRTRDTARKEKAHERKERIREKKKVRSEAKYLAQKDRSDLAYAKAHSREFPARMSMVDRFVWKLSPSLVCMPERIAVRIVSKLDRLKYTRIGVGRWLLGKRVLQFISMNQEHPHCRDRLFHMKTEYLR